MSDTPVLAQPHTLVTLWFVNTDNPKAVLDTEPTPDRGFARKYLAHFNPRWPLTHIGDFDMTRSASPGMDEFYIGGYPGLSVVHTIIPGLIRLSELPESYRELVNAKTIFATATVAVEPDEHDESALFDDSADYAGLGGFAHWADGELKRAFSATRITIFEDIGLPEPFESPFWTGNVAAQGIQLPFIPSEMAAAAAETWLGFPVSQSGPDIPITAFAVDGRPEAKSEPDTPLPGAQSSESTRQDSDASESYDDYTPGGDPYAGVKSTRDLVADVAKTVGKNALKVGRSAWSGPYGVRGIASKIGDEIRRRARNAGR